MILALETSCDETACALVTEDGHVRANVVSSQAALHARYGGVVPEGASRRHLALATPGGRGACPSSPSTPSTGTWLRSSSSRTLSSRPFSACSRAAVTRCCSTSATT